MVFTYLPQYMTSCIHYKLRIFLRDFHLSLPVLRLLKLHHLSSSRLEVLQPILAKQPISVMTRPKNIIYPMCVIFALVTACSSDIAHVPAQDMYEDILRATHRWGGVGVGNLPHIPGLCPPPPKRKIKAKQLISPALHK